MKKLELAPNLSLPIEAVTKKFGFFGQNGSGKTYGAMKLAELMLDAGAQIVVIDPVGKWYGLRLDKNGTDPSGIQIPVFGGLHGDVPLESTGGELVADLIVDRGISAVLDVSQFDYDADRTRFIEHFMRRLFNRKKAAPSALHLFIEEAQEFLPDRPNKGEEKMLREVLRAGKIGRNHGFGWTLITPRPQEVTTKARNLSEVVLAFQTNGTHERKAIAEWVKEKGEDLNVVDLLPKLKPGFAHAWSPSWLEFSGTIHISEKRTADVSASPKVGAKAIEAKPLGSIDLEQLKKAMAATIEKRKAEDPDELRKQLAAANSRIRQLEKSPAKTVSVAKPVVDQAAIARAVARDRAERRKKQWPVLERLQRGAGGLGDLITAIGDLAKIVNDTSVENVATPAALLAPREHRLNPSSPVAPLSGKPERRSGGHAGGDSRERLATDLKPGQKKILNAMAELEALGVDTPSRSQLGMVAGYNLTGGTGAQHLADLGAAGYVEMGNGTVRLTEEGRLSADATNTPATLGELHERVLAKLSPGQRKIAEHLISIYPEGISRADLGVAVNYNLTGGTGAQHLADLVNVGAATIPNKGSVMASKLLFPDSLGALV